MCRSMDKNVLLHLRLCECRRFIVNKVYQNYMSITWLSAGITDVMETNTYASMLCRLTVRLPMVKLTSTVYHVLVAFSTILTYQA